KAIPSRPRSPPLSTRELRSRKVPMRAPLETSTIRISPPCSTMNRRVSLEFPIGAVRNSGEENTVEVATGCSVRLLEGPGAGPAPPPTPPPLSPLQATKNRPQRTKQRERSLRDAGRDMSPAYYEMSRHSILKMRNSDLFFNNDLAGIQSDFCRIALRRKRRSAAVQDTDPGFSRRDRFSDCRRTA